MNKDIILQLTPSQVRAHYDPDGHFFDRANMRFSGDTMRSFGALTHGGERYLYRKPTAEVNVFGKVMAAGREFFNAWQVQALSDDTVRLRVVSQETKAAIYEAVTT